MSFPILAWYRAPALEPCCERCRDVGVYGVADPAWTGLQDFFCSCAAGDGWRAQESALWALTEFLDWMHGETP